MFAYLRGIEEFHIAVFEDYEPEYALKVHKHHITGDFFCFYLDNEGFMLDAMNCDHSPILFKDVGNYLENIKNILEV